MCCTEFFFFCFHNLPMTVSFGGGLGVTPVRPQLLIVNLLYKSQQMYHSNKSLCSLSQIVFYRMSDKLHTLEEFIFKRQRTKFFYI